MSGYTNEAGEPIMSGEAYRFESFLDSTQPPYDPDDYLAWDDDPDEDDEGEEPHICLNRVDGHWYVITYGFAPYQIHAERCPSCKVVSALSEETIRALDRTGWDPMGLTLNSPEATLACLREDLENCNEDDVREALRAAIAFVETL